MLPGAADYSHSDILQSNNNNNNVTIAGELTFFIVQAKDALGNKKNFDGDSQGDQHSAGEQFSIEIIGSEGSHSGKVTYVEGGKYRVDYTLTKAGYYQVHVRTGGSVIYCRQGEKNKCSPFALTVLPGRTVPSMCEGESSLTSIDSVVEGRAGETGIIHVQAKDAYSNNRKIGGDAFILKLTSVTNNTGDMWRTIAMDHILYHTQYLLQEFMTF